MSKPRCETCPFWTCDNGRTGVARLGVCHYEPRQWQTYEDGFCRHHPDAPKVVTVTKTQITQQPSGYNGAHETWERGETHTEIREADDA